MSSSPTTDGSESVRLFNHTTAALGDLDMRMISHLSPGGNWQQIPPGLSKRVDQIRERSKTRGLIHTTYYGRLRWDAPSYTISTYFGRPGNGCHVHPDQDRVLSAREAARLQSFPDSFKFYGTQRSVAMQIGNAVPPLLGAAVGTVIPGSRIVDLFAGAGGLSYGLELAGKHTLLAVENNRDAAQAYRASHPNATVIEGDLTSTQVVESLISQIDQRGGLDVLVGGPPCQSFSTAGRRQSDDRSTLVGTYVDVALLLKPPTVVIENVPGIKSFMGGRVLRSALARLSDAGYSVQVWDLRADSYGVPQRRHRVFIVASKHPIAGPPAPLSAPFREGVGHRPSLRDAIGDLPPLAPGQGYQEAEVTLPPPSNPFQMYARGKISYDAYAREIRSTTSASQTAIDFRPQPS